MSRTNGTGLSACIICMNEEDRIEACIASLDFCDEVVVVDSHSTDGTRARATSLGARVIERDWPGFGAQKDFAVNAASHDWVLCLDADERVSPELRDQILELRERGFDGRAGFRFPRCSRYFGRWIRRGTWYPDHQMRLFDRRRGHWLKKPVHESVEIEGPVLTLQGELMHEPYRKLSEHLATIDKYSTLGAEQAFVKGRRAHVWNLVVNPAVRFVRFYFLKLGFLEGWRGLLLAFLAAHYVRLKYAKLLLIARDAEGQSS